MTPPSPASAATADDVGNTPTATSQPDGRRAHLESRFARLRRHRDRANRNELALQFMPLARSIARDYHTPRDREDLEQVAYLALVKAIDRFDPARGNSFATYAVPTIAGEIKNYLRDHTWDTHVPRRLQDRALRAARVRGELTAQLGRAPRVEEIAARLDFDPATVIEALTAADARDAHSLDREVDRGESGGPTLADVLARGAEEPGFARAIERAALRDRLGSLTDQERQVLGLRFLYDLPQSEIAAQLGLSQMQVSRLLRRVLERIRRSEANHGNEGTRHLPARLAGHSENTSVWSRTSRGTADSALRSHHEHLNPSE